MQGRFSQMSDQVSLEDYHVAFFCIGWLTFFFVCARQIIGRIDEVGGRVDDLEKSIGDLMEQVPCLFLFIFIHSSHILSYQLMCLLSISKHLLPNESISHT